MIRTCIISCLLLSCLYGVGQTRHVDSVRKVVYNATNSQLQLEALLSICQKHRSISKDSLQHYTSFAKKLALQLHDQPRLLWSEYYQAECFVKTGMLDSALKYAENIINKTKAASELIPLYFQTNRFKGTVLVRQSRYTEAIEQFYFNLRLAEQKSDLLFAMMAKNGIGWAYMEMDQYIEAIDWFNKAWRTSSNHQHVVSYGGILFSNMASSFNNINKTDSAEFFIQKAIAAAREGEDFSSLANALNILADIYIHTGRQTKAETPLREALEIRRLIGDPYYVVSDMYQIAAYYATVGQTQKGIQLSLEGIELANKYKLDSKLRILYESLAENYKAASDYRKYSEVLQKIIELKDSTYSQNSEQALAELSAKYESQKQETLITQQKLSLVQQNYLLYGSLALAIVVLLSALLLFNSYKKRQRIKLNQMLETEKMHSAEAVIVAEENERKRIAADLHDNLGVYAASIASNLDNINVSNNDTKNVIALQELRQNSQLIVSQLSDTIWALKKDALSLTAISDRVKVFIHRVQTSYPDVKMDVTEDIEVDHLLPPSQAFHLFQVMQEAIINALRHSRCTEITVHISSNASWQVKISDNGRGMSTYKQNAGREGNGIANMRSRSVESGWSIEWLPADLSGTVVQIQPTTN